jgi:NADH:ubiquinone oxidoreductase subunit C
MNTEQIIQDITDQLADRVFEVTVINSRRATILIDPEQILPLSSHLHHSLGFRFIIATALHSRFGFEIYYHFSKDETGLLLNIKVILPHQDPEIESLSNMFNASNWIEREIHELFGINFRNHPNQEKLISEGNWAEGVYPYRNEQLIPEAKR